MDVRVEGGPAGRSFSWPAARHALLVGARGFESSSGHSGNPGAAWEDPHSGAIRAGPGASAEASGGHLTERDEKSPPGRSGRRLEGNWSSRDADERFSLEVATGRRGVWRPRLLW